jgi:hypothetical protein
MTVAQIARRYDFDARRVSNWIKKFSSGAALVPVEVMSVGDGFLKQPCIEIDLPCGTRLRCGSETDMDLLTGIIAALRSKR